MDGSYEPREKRFWDDVAPTYWAGTSIENGRRDSKNSYGWEADTFTAQLKECFPNNYWDTYVPPARLGGESDANKWKNESNWVGVQFNYDNCGDAKRYAFENNRPLLVYAPLVTGCGIQYSFHELVFYEGSPFWKFIRDNKIVFVYMMSKEGGEGSTDEVRTLAKGESDVVPLLKLNYNRYGSFANTPFICMFKVRPDTKWYNKTNGALHESLVTPIQWKPDCYTVGSYMPGFEHGLWYCGIPNPAVGKFDPNTFCKQIKAVFPNREWPDLSLTLP